MKDSELKNLKKAYEMQLAKLKKIQELINDSNVKEFLKLTKIKYKDQLEFDEKSVLEEILKKAKITSTNGIYVCTGTYLLASHYLDEEIEYYPVNVDFSDPDAEFRLYFDIEDLHRVKAYKKPKYFANYDSCILTSEFERNNIVLNPFDTWKDFNGLNDVRTRFFMESLKNGQGIARKKVMEKYKKI